jgi:hypothetical protein
LHAGAGGGKSFRQRIQILDEDAGMCFVGWSELGLGAKMKFETASPKPGAISFGENCRLRDLGHVKDRNEEMSCPFFFADWHRQLYVVETRKDDPVLR